MRNYNMVHKMNKQQIYNYYILFYIYIYIDILFSEIRTGKGREEKALAIW